MSQLHPVGIKTRTFTLQNIIDSSRLYIALESSLWPKQIRSNAQPSTKDGLTQSKPNSIPIKSCKSPLLHGLEFFHMLPPHLKSKARGGGRACGWQVNTSKLPRKRTKWSRKLRRVWYTSEAPSYPEEARWRLQRRPLPNSMNCSSLCHIWRSLLFQPRTIIFTVEPLKWTCVEASTWTLEVIIIPYYSTTSCSCSKLFTWICSSKIASENATKRSFKEDRIQQ